MDLLFTVQSSKSTKEIIQCVYTAQSVRRNMIQQCSADIYFQSIYTMSITINYIPQWCDPLLSTLFIFKSI